MHDYVRQRSYETLYALRRGVPVRELAEKFVVGRKRIYQYRDKGARMERNFYQWYMKRTGRIIVGALKNQARGER